MPAASASTRFQSPFREGRPRRMRATDHPEPDLRRRRPQGEYPSHASSAPLVALAPVCVPTPTPPPALRAPGRYRPVTKHRTLTAAMTAGDELAEVEIRYRMLAEVFKDQPQLRANLNPALERAKAEIVRLRALAKRDATPSDDDSNVVPFDSGRFRKSAGS